MNDSDTTLPVDRPVNMSDFTHLFWMAGVYLFCFVGSNNRISGRICNEYWDLRSFLRCVGFNRVYCLARGGVSTYFSSVVQSRSDGGV